MAGKRKVKAEDSLVQRKGDEPPKPGTYLARRARAALRADESRRLDVDETRERMHFTEEQLRILDCVAAGIPVRGAREVIAALRLKADFLLSKPASAIDHRIGVLVVKDPYSEDVPRLAASVAVAALPEGQAKDDADEGEGEEEP